MKVAVEVFVDSILLLLITAASVFFIVISLMTADARNFHSTSVAKIEASDGSQVVMEECMAEAAVALAADLLAVVAQVVVAQVPVGKNIEI